MSTLEIGGKIKELRELRRMADELQAEIDAIQDAIDRKIIKLIAEGYTERQIAASVTETIKKISNIGIHKRIVKMRGELLAELA